MAVPGVSWSYGEAIQADANIASGNRKLDL